MPSMPCAVFFLFCFFLWSRKGFFRVNIHNNDVLKMEMFPFAFLCSDDTIVKTILTDPLKWLKTHACQASSWWCLFVKKQYAPIITGGCTKCTKAKEISETVFNQINPTSKENSGNIKIQPCKTLMTNRENIYHTKWGN